MAEKIRRGFVPVVPVDRIICPFAKRILYSRQKIEGSSKKAKRGCKECVKQGHCLTRKDICQVHEQMMPMEEFWDRVENATDVGVELNNETSKGNVNPR
jgi:hypothetical protein